MPKIKEFLDYDRDLFFLNNFTDPDKYWPNTIEPSKMFYILKESYKGIYKTDAWSILMALDYSDFLRTPYWKAISYKIKEDAGFKCSRCGATKHLVVHHKTYKHHGYELDYLEDLECICQSCHENIHENEEF